MRPTSFRPCLVLAMGSYALVRTSFCRRNQARRSGPYGTILLIGRNDHARQNHRDSKPRFDCQTGGSVFQFLMQLDQLTFPEAVERVAKRYGITIERAEGSRIRQESGERDLFYRINERAANNYHRILVERPEGKKALDYLKARGVD